jgi:hypothetical protein
MELNVNTEQSINRYLKGLKLSPDGHFKFQLLSGGDDEADAKQGVTIVLKRKEN